MAEQVARAAAERVAIDVYTYSTVDLLDENDKKTSFAELSRFTTLRRLPYPVDREASAAMVRRDGLAVLVNINGTLRQQWRASCCCACPVCACVCACARACPVVVRQRVYI